MLFSLIVRPAGLPAMEMFSANKAVALASASTLRRLTGLSVELKWPNDLFVNGHKLGGILIESRLSGSEVEWLVAGIGINANQIDGLPPGATSLALELGRDVPMESWLTDIAFCVTECLMKDVRSPKLPADYRRHLMFLDQTRTYYQEDGSPLVGRIEDVDEQGRLLLVDTSGAWHAFAHRSIFYFGPGL